MRRAFAIFAVASAAILSSCSKKEVAEAPKPAVETPAPVAEPAPAPHATVLLKSGNKVEGVIVASSPTDMTVTGDDGIERKIPLAQIKSVDYGGPDTTPEPETKTSALPVAPKKTTKPSPVPVEKPQTARESAPPPASEPPAKEQSPFAAAPLPPAPKARTLELPAGSEVSVRTNEVIDSRQATEGQTFDAQVTRNITDEHGEVVVPRRSTARVVIKSVSQGGKIRGASDLVLDLKSISIGGKTYRVEAAEVGQKGKDGVGANKRTATYTGGGAALGAIIGAIAGGGKGAAIGAGAGAGAGALTQILTKGKAIKVPAESVLTFKLDRPLVVTASPE